MRTILEQLRKGTLDLSYGLLSGDTTYREGLANEDPQTLLEIFRLLQEQGLAEKITHIELTGCHFTGSQLNFSIFKNLKTLYLDSSNLSLPPIISGCTELRNLSLSNNNLHALPDINQCPKLCRMDITNNKLSNEDIRKIRLYDSKIFGRLPQVFTDLPRDLTFAQQLKEFYPGELLTSFVDGVNNINELTNDFFSDQYDKESVNKKSYFWSKLTTQNNANTDATDNHVAHSSSSSSSTNINSQNAKIGDTKSFAYQSPPELAEIRYSLLNYYDSAQPSKNIVDDEQKIEYDGMLTAIHEICLAFYNIAVAVGENPDLEDFKKYISSTDDPLLYSQIKALFTCCAFYEPKFTKTDLYENFITRNENKYLSSNALWLPDLSFLSGHITTQSTIGKLRSEPHKFSKGLLLSMRPEFWHVDILSALPYLTVNKKKNTKMRFSNEQPDTLVTKENDEEHPIENGEYIYGLSLNGGLLIQQYNSIDHHSQLRAGQYLVCAGHIGIKNGKITSINNNSGHMCPSETHMQCAAVYLYANGFLDKECNIEIINPDERQANKTYTVAALIEKIQNGKEEIPSEILPWMQHTLSPTSDTSASKRTKLE